MNRPYPPRAEISINGVRHVRADTADWLLEALREAISLLRKARAKADYDYERKDTERWEAAAVALCAQVEEVKS